MSNQPQQFIAGERLEDLVAGMRQMPVVVVHDARAQITFNLDDDTFVSWARAAERYAANLRVAGSDLSWQDRINLAAQRLADEVSEAIRKARNDG